MIKWYKEKFKGWVITPFIVLLLGLDMNMLGNDHHATFTYLSGFFTCWLIILENTWLSSEPED